MSATIFLIVAIPSTFIRTYIDDAQHPRFIALYFVLGLIRILAKIYLLYIEYRLLEHLMSLNMVSQKLPSYLLKMTLFSRVISYFSIIFYPRQTTYNTLSPFNIMISIFSMSLYLYLAINHINSNKVLT